MCVLFSVVYYLLFLVCFLWFNVFSVISLFIEEEDEEEEQEQEQWRPL